MIIKNSTLSVRINAFGAEVKSILKDNMEYLWQSDPKYWGRSSPILFPIVGRLLDDEYFYEGKNYKMTQHGFARDQVFELVENSETECTFLLKDNEASLKMYPFKFNLLVNYKLHDNELIVSWEVENINEVDMYFQIGAHPAFNFVNGSYIDINKKTNKYELNGTPYIHNVQKDVDVHSIEITNDTFTKDALVYDNIDKISLRDKDKRLVVKCEGFPFVGIWSKLVDDQNAPFVCIEPWHGIADCSFHNKQLQDKKGINVLSPSNKFIVSYSIIIK
jgi:galactose mutarotase-like enzyme